MNTVSPFDATHFFFFCRKTKSLLHYTDEYTRFIYIYINICLYIRSIRREDRIHTRRERAIVYAMNAIFYVRSAKMTGFTGKPESQCNVRNISNVHDAMCSNRPNDPFFFSIFRVDFVMYTRSKERRLTLFSFSFLYPNTHTHFTSFTYS